MLFKIVKPQRKLKIRGEMRTLHWVSSVLYTENYAKNFNSENAVEGGVDLRKACSNFRCWCRVHEIEIGER